MDVTAEQVTAKAAYIEAVGQMIVQADDDIARLHAELKARTTKRDILKVRLAEATRGIDEFQSDSVVIRPKDFTRRPLSPTKRREMRRKQSYLWSRDER